MGAAYFYHMTHTPLEATLPVLLDKALGAGWRVVVRAREEARLGWLDERLWLGPKTGFLAHGVAGGPHDADQPVLLTAGERLAGTTAGISAGNGANCLVAVDGAEVAPDEVTALERVMILFDGNDPDAVERARGQWRSLTTGGCSAKYWSQESGRWEMKAEA